MPPADHPDVHLLRRCAHAVRDALASLDPSRYGEHKGMGADGTGTELVDEVAERAVLAVLDEAGSDVGVLSEEAGRVERGGKRTLVLDPVDGSKNAIRRIPFYCTSLALADGDRLSSVAAGLVLNLATGDEYAAVRGEGAALNGERLRVPAFRADDLVAAASFGRYVGDRTVALARRGGVNVRSLGAAALEMSLVAHGAVDLYFFEREVLRVTDIAAATLVVREAGGVVMYLAGDALDVPLDLATRTALLAATSRDALDLLDGGDA